jgi:uncharacterized membrane protein YkoI
MRNVIRSILVAAALAASALPALAAEGARAPDTTNWQIAQEDGRFRGRGPFGQPPRLLPLEVVLGNVAAAIPGRHLSVDGPAQRNGRWIYRIKWLTVDGRVLIVFADAQTGEILGSRG